MFRHDREVRRETNLITWSESSGFPSYSCQCDFNQTWCNLRTVFHDNSRSARRCHISYVTRSLRYRENFWIQTFISCRMQPCNTFLYCSLSFCCACAYKESPQAFCGYPGIFQRFLLWDHHSMLPPLPLRQAARPFPIEQDDSGHCGRSWQPESVSV